MELNFNFPTIKAYVDQYGPIVQETLQTGFDHAKSVLIQSRTWVENQSFSPYAATAAATALAVLSAVCCVKACKKSCSVIVLAGLAAASMGAAVELFKANMAQNAS